MNNVGLYVLALMGVLAVLDLWCIYRGSRMGAAYFYGWLILVGIGILCAVIGVYGVGR